jgi:Divergent InlB B-repeat domain/PASTA domain
VIHVRLTRRPLALGHRATDRAEVEPISPLTPRGAPTNRALRAQSQPQTRVRSLASAGDLVVSAGAPDATPGALIPEPSVAVNGPDALMTWNWNAAVTTNGGDSFMYLDPPSRSAYGGFCCDQSAYYDPSRDLYIWILQYLEDAAGNNAIRILIAKGSDQLAAGAFTWWDVTPQAIGAPSGVWYDQPKVARSDNDFYMEVTGYSGSSFQGSVVYRFPLNDLAGGENLHYDYYHANTSSPGFIEGATSTMYFAGHVNSSTLRVYSWPESADASGIKPFDVQHHSYPRTLPYQCPRTGAPATSDWCQRPTGEGHYSHSDRIMGGWIANGVIGFGWDAGQGKGDLRTFPYPYLHFVRIAASSMKLIDEPILWSDKYAFSFASVAPNRSGDLGGAVMYGGGSTYENCAILVHDGYTPASGFWELDSAQLSDADPNEPEGGDYLSARPDPANPSGWAATCYALHGGGDGGNMQPYALSFARQVPAATLSVSKTGTGNGTIGSSPARINCGDVCVESFAHDAAVTVTAAPAAGSTFTGWSGDCSGTGTCKLTMSSNHSVQATFTKVETLNVAKAGTGKGQVSSSPAGIDCGSKCSVSFVHGATVTLTAAPDEHSDFLGWSGDCSGTAQCTVSMSAARSVTATFQAVCIVPRVVGLSLGGARSAIQGAGCTIGKTKKVYSKQRKGSVLSQRPAADTHVPPGAPVSLVLSRGRRKT